MNTVEESVRFLCGMLFVPSDEVVVWLDDLMAQVLRDFVTADWDEEKVRRLVEATMRQIYGDGVVREDEVQGKKMLVFKLRLKYDLEAPTGSLVTFERWFQGLDNPMCRLGPFKGVLLKGPESCDVLHVTEEGRVTATPAADLLNVDVLDPQPIDGDVDLPAVFYRFARLAGLLLPPTIEGLRATIPLLQKIEKIRTGERSEERKLVATLPSPPVEVL